MNAEFVAIFKLDFFILLNGPIKYHILNNSKATSYLFTSLTLNCQKNLKIACLRKKKKKVSRYYYNLWWNGSPPTATLGLRFD